MNKKIATLFLIGCLLIASFVSIGVMAEKQQIKKDSANLSFEEKLNCFLNSLNEKNIFDSKKISTIRRNINFNTMEGEVVPGTYIFNPCDPIDIEGIGLVDYDGAFGYLALEDGTVELDNTFNGNYEQDIIAAICIFEDFEGDIIGDPEEISPLEVTGKAGWFCLIEFSYLLEMSIEGEFKLGTEVPVIISNANESFEIEISESVFTAYRTVLLSSFKVYEEQIQEPWTIPIAGSETWTWYQKDQNGNQVAKGQYTIAGEFTINGRVHPLAISFEIYQKSRSHKKIHIFLSLLEKYLYQFPIFQQLLNL